MALQINQQNPPICVDYKDITQEDIQRVLTPFIDKAKDDGWLEDLISPLATNVIGSIGSARASIHFLLKQQDLYNKLAELADCIGLMDGDSCKCVADKLCDKSSGLWEKYWSAFLEHFGSELPDLNVSDIPSAETMQKGVQCLKDKVGDMGKTCNPEAIQKRLKGINYAYMIASIISLGISWKYLYDSIEAINNATQLMKTIRGKLNKLKHDKITPILKFLNKVKQNKMVHQKDFDKYTSMIDISLALLNEWKDQIKREASNMEKKAVNNVISAVAMGTSAVTSFGFNSLNISNASKIANYAIGTAQGGTAVANVSVAVICAKKYKQLNSFNAELRKEINLLQNARDKFDEYLQKYLQQYEQFGDEKEVEEDLNNPVNSWSNEQVVEWVISVDSKTFTKTGEIFKEFNVDGEDLLDMDKRTLDSMNVIVFHQKKLLRNIKKLKTQYQ